MDLGSHSLPNTVFTFKVRVLVSDVWKERLGGRYGGFMKGRSMVTAKQLTDRGRQDVSSAYITSVHIPGSSSNAL